MGSGSVALLFPLFLAHGLQNLDPDILLSRSHQPQRISRFLFGNKLKVSLNHFNICAFQHLLEMLFLQRSHKSACLWSSPKVKKVSHQYPFCWAILLFNWLQDSITLASGFFPVSLLQFSWSILKKNATITMKNLFTTVKSALTFMKSYLKPWRIISFSISLPFRAGRFSGRLSPYQLWSRRNPMKPLISS